ncbi:hypothetical protein [Paenibacillus bouchesdurhonensis]|uniref:hypothetical protein n=1 Tax=Paenibacillus bouchesdurhonensis TaxID=1870990 RepID=UPI000DA5FC04|nr:hypothetical protein [Paenibacillus bouchesdurhonensis]
MAQKKQPAKAVQATKAAKAVNTASVVNAANASAAKATGAGKSTGEAARVVKTTAASEAAEPVYPLDEIMQQSEVLMGVKPEVLAGTFHHLPGDMSSASLTVQEAKKQVQLFLNRKVK